MHSLAPYATLAAATLGRMHAESASALRSPFQRDRDRIIHSGAFRKLRNKTQVFVEFEGDFYRTRLTHSLEVAQIARTIARQLALDEDLTEAVALAHDLGHTCFGHAGEEALNRAMQPYGGFDHNDQAFRVLTQLEYRYPLFSGLNLSWETLEGIVKHNGPLLPAKPNKPVPPSIAAFQQQWDLQLAHYCGLEAQVAALADDIAYNTHDVDDGVRAGMLSVDAIAGLPVFDTIIGECRQRYPNVSPMMLVQEAVRQVIGVMVTDVLDTTRANLQRVQPPDVAAVRAAGQPLAAASPTMYEYFRTFRAFLMDNMYRQENVSRFNVKADMIVTGLFGYYFNNLTCLPAEWQKRISITAEEETRARLVADYIAGMTDRFAITAYQRAFSTEKFV